MPRVYHLALKFITPSRVDNGKRAHLSTYTLRLRAAFGKLPVAGIPRKRYGMVRGFSVVDPGGNWLRIYKLGDTEDEAAAEMVQQS